MEKVVAEEYGSCFRKDMDINDCDCLMMKKEMVVVVVDDDDDYNRR